MIVDPSLGDVAKEWHEPVTLSGTKGLPEHHTETYAADEEVFSPEDSASSDMEIENFLAAQQVMSAHTYPPRHSSHASTKGHPSLRNINRRSSRHHCPEAMLRTDHRLRPQSPAPARN
ncbi:hypothetical protein NDU88_004939 [Pleurodeles waltl]|uniref:Uncharacterized protein n=1 Tax=Pleurodeles waltl TaxID=8319 RepID=A0AAV7LLG5_PLEWA|nr:hypothetical protein NDU88_004939 [Pleurodeles waltl]